MIPRILLFFHHFHKKITQKYETEKEALKTTFSQLYTEESGGECDPVQRKTDTIRNDLFMLISSQFDSFKAYQWGVPDFICVSIWNLSLTPKIIKNGTRRKS